jgi:hypothetical protein
MITEAQARLYRLCAAEVARDAEKALRSSALLLMFPSLLLAWLVVWTFRN